MPVAAVALVAAFAAVIMADGAVVPVIGVMRYPFELASEPFELTLEGSFTLLLLADGFPFAPFVKLMR
jgi:hypothetical protein